MAAHVVYDATTGCLFPREVVELDGEGTVLRHFPLVEEISGTEWFSGVLVMAFFPPERKKGETFNSFRQRLWRENCDCPAGFPERRGKAFGIVPFNVFAGEFLPASRIIAL